MSASCVKLAIPHAESKPACSWQFHMRVVYFARETRDDMRKRISSPTDSRVNNLREEPYNIHLCVSGAFNEFDGVRNILQGTFLCWCVLIFRAYGTFTRYTCALASQAHFLWVARTQPTHFTKCQSSCVINESKTFTLPFFMRIWT